MANFQVQLLMTSTVSLIARVSRLVGIFFIVGRLNMSNTKYFITVVAYRDGSLKNTQSTLWHEIWVPSQNILTLSWPNLFKFLR